MAPISRAAQRGARRRRRRRRRRKGATGTGGRRGGHHAGRRGRGGAGTGRRGWCAAAAAAQRGAGADGGFWRRGRALARGGLMVTPHAALKELAYVHSGVLGEKSNIKVVGTDSGTPTASPSKAPCSDGARVHWTLASALMMSLRGLGVGGGGPEKNEPPSPLSSSRRRASAHGA